MRPVINKKSRSEVVAIGDENIGIIYLEKRGSVSVGERMQIDEFELSKNKAQIVATKLIKTIAKDKNISFEAAQELLSPKPVNGVAVDNSNIIYDYVEEFTELQSLSAINSSSLAVTIATIFIQSRAAYPIQVDYDATIDATALDIIPQSINLKNKQQIAFGGLSGQKVIVKGNHGSDVSIIQVEPIEQPLTEGDIGFLVDGKKYIVGSDEWAIDDTKALDENLVAAIYDFYQNELSGWVKPEPVATSEGETEGEFLQLTGTDSIGESSITESVTRDLVAGSVS
ncbi:MAG: hypothetical protein ACKPGB_13825 [Dolichospermum sp.]